MPTYEYDCDAGHVSEHRQSINDDPLERCPVEGCDSRARRRISAGAGVISGKRAPSPSENGGACSPSGFT